MSLIPRTRVFSTQVKSGALREDWECYIRQEQCDKDRHRSTVHGHDKDSKRRRDRERVSCSSHSRWVSVSSRDKHSQLDSTSLYVILNSVPHVCTLSLYAFLFHSQMYKYKVCWAAVSIWIRQPIVNWFWISRMFYVLFLSLYLCDNLRGKTETEQRIGRLSVKHHERLFAKGEERRVQCWHQWGVIFHNDNTL